MPQKTEAIYNRSKIPTPKTTYQGARKKCTDCVGGERRRIKDCPISDCLLWPHRYGITPAAAKRKGYDVGKSSPRLTMKDLRSECIWCMGGGTEAYKDVKDCKDNFCGLFPFRMGHR